MKTLIISDETYEKIKGQIIDQTEKDTIKIKNTKRDVIYTSNKPTFKEAIEEAVENKVNLGKANLRNADLCEVNLSGANLYEANLFGADLCGADLSKANLSEALLCRADLSRANLNEALLCGADLSGALFYKADLSSANLGRARFYGRGGKIKLTKEQVPVFLEALGFEIV